MSNRLNLRKRALAGASLVLTLAAAGAGRAADWPHYAGDAGATRYSPLDQIDRGNVARLKPAWTFHTGDIQKSGKGGPRSGFETTPLMVDGRLYLTTPFSRVIALDPVTGKQLWAFDPKIDRTWGYGDGLINRGVEAWSDPERPAGAACGRRIFEATLDARLISLDGATGRPCADFGRGGEVSLRHVDRYQNGYYHMTSPPVVVDGVVVVGSAIDDNSRVDMPSGVIRGFDARTGALKWSFEPMQRPPGLAPGAWKTGAGNAWSIMTADPARHLVFAPTGSASPDYYGGLRPGDDKWANSVVALDARTGRLVWGFQLVHHDLWDYDTASSPVLADVPVGGRMVPAVIAGNKTGMLYVLDRDTGKPLYPVEERPVPVSDVPGEVSAPTQPFPVDMPALAPQSLTPDQAWGLTEADRSACRALFATAKGHAIFSPPTLEGGLAIPGNVGGMNWSGFAYDPGRKLLVVDVANYPAWLKLIPAKDFDTAPRTPHMEYTEQEGAPYAISRGGPRAPSGMPCSPPPWGSLVAVDLVSHKVAWSTPLGSLKEAIPIPNLPAGSLGLGGPIVTAGGLVLVAGTIDRQLHGFDIDTGKEIWTAELPASAHATPMTYQLGGKQYLVIAAGGSAKIDEERQDDAVIAFTLP